ncbi:thiol reductant ABC exporter CydD subunit [Deinobacterium chartae]|uniref:Thiol reductant ABC exporter CydD subunit n=1 Tax=Deinobacterium chartae TaxID=521158 RepID=A0A841HYK6_9DEIO|nr:thiol reductant ABC exporter subunit CydD [Deinobacterium chartae]MBB6098477.1 thiol reductant ABC exporter CydD subunit [Deinobacterium chartae]
MKRLMREAAVRPLIATTALLGLLMAAATVAQWWGFAQAVNLAFLEGQPLITLGPTLALMILAFALRALLGWAREVVGQRAAAAVKRDFRSRLAARLVQLGPAYTGGERSGELATALTEGVEKLDAFYARFVPQAALTAAIPPLIALAVFRIDWPSGLLLALTGPLIPVFMWLVGTLAEGASRAQWLALSRLGAHFVDRLQNLPLLTAYGRVPSQREEFARVGEAYRASTLKVLRVAFLSGFILELAATLSTALVAVTVGVRVLGGHLDFLPALFVLLLTPEFFAPLRQLGADHHAGMEGSAAAVRLYDVLNAPAAQSGSEAAPDPAGGVFVERLTLRYGEAAALEDLTLSFPPGSRTALVGPSGAGKSSLLAALLLFVRPQQGVLRVGSTPLDTVSPEAWRERVALVPQRPVLFAGTLAENLRISRPGADDRALWAALEAAGAAAFAKEGGGLDMRLEEGGRNLSGGQRQRVAIARAFLKDAPLLLLDEPTSQLDEAAAADLREALETLAQGRTVIEVAHRADAARAADRVVFLERGRLMAVGTHPELLARSEAYRRAWEAA